MCFAAFTTGAAGRTVAQAPTISSGGFSALQNIARQRTGLSGPSAPQAPQQQTQGSSLLGGAIQGSSLLGAGVAARRRPQKERAQR